MRWQDKRQSGNVDDRRRRGPAIGRRGAAVGGGGILVLAIIVMLLGEDPSLVLDAVNSSGGGGGASSGPGAGGAAAGDPAGDEQARFASAVLGDTEDAWTRVFAAEGLRYQPPVLVLFNDRVESACGFQSAAVGPFYCPGDSQLYVDLSFFEELHRRFQAPGDFAQAYVIAHEVGHHVQALLGIDDRARRLSSGRSASDRNAISVMQELQADCFAGIWGFHASQQRDFLERGDLQEGLDAAAAIGDDRLQRSAGRRVQPESFTHGSSRQRMQWFMRGLESGRIGDCDSFAAAGLRL